MKKIIILALMLILTGCGSAPVKTSNKPQIYTSFYAIYDFVEKILNLMIGNHLQKIC